MKRHFNGLGLFSQDLDFLVVLCPSFGSLLHPFEGFSPHPPPPPMFWVHCRSMSLCFGSGDPCGVGGCWKPACTA